MSKCLFQIWNEKNKNMYNRFLGLLQLNSCLEPTWYVLYQGNKLNNKVYICFYICNLMPGTISRTKNKSKSNYGLV